jgi:hypothetical protein
VDCLRPSCPNDSCLRDSDEEVTQWRGVKDVSVLDGGDGMLHQ